jgi:ATP-dependent protease Clp ATPase subunit
MIAPVLVCSLCGKRHDEVRKIIVGQAVDAQGRFHEVSLCDECIATFMTIMASEDREWFDRQVDASRSVLGSVRD